ncbi:MAG: TIGR04211 family SH3 domain-containing protein [Candidatus Binatia bacterium]|nr:TIGR04211 family SH3 domain-containing protein [Candidatus Binatia bacterium]
MKVRFGRSSAAALAATMLVLAAGGPARAAEASWVSGEVKLNLRRGASTEYRIIGTVSSHQPVTVLGSENGWTHVRLEDEREGWIPGGYLSGDPPPAIRLSQLETETRTLRTRLEKTEDEAERLLSENRSFETSDTEQRERIAQLTTENHELRALVRWREWVTGASILVFGMIVGAILSRSSRNKRSNRLRV